MGLVPYCLNFLQSRRLGIIGRRRQGDERGAIADYPRKSFDELVQLPGDRQPPDSLPEQRADKACEHVCSREAQVCGMSKHESPQQPVARFDRGFIFRRRHPLSPTLDHDSIRSSGSPAQSGNTSGKRQSNRGRSRAAPGPSARHRGRQDEAISTPACP
jgi:hypothetical protein